MKPPLHDLMKVSIANVKTRYCREKVKILKHMKKQRNSHLDLDSFHKNLRYYSERRLFNGGGSFMYRAHSRKKRKELKNVCVYLVNVAHIIYNYKI